MLEKIFTALTLTLLHGVTLSRKYRRESQGIAVNLCSRAERLKGTLLCNIQQKCTMANQSPKHSNGGKKEDSSVSIQPRQAVEYRWKARAAHLAKNEFMARMSHEMLTPINTIMGITQLVKGADIPLTIHEYLDEIIGASNHLLRIIKDVLEVSDMEFNSFELKHSAFSFLGMVGDVMNTVAHLIKEKQHKVSYVIDKSIPPLLVGDEKRLAYVITSILRNAIKFTPKRGTVSFKAFTFDAADKTVVLQIEIADNGIGISAEQQNELFSLFEQADGSSTRQHEGIGLGLALSKRIIELMGGTIRVDSELGKGSKFVVTCNLGKP